MLTSGSRAGPWTDEQRRDQVRRPEAAFELEQAALAAIRQALAAAGG